MPAGDQRAGAGLGDTAPTMPPISACDELDGMPYHQVMTFQVIAPISAPKTRGGRRRPGRRCPCRPSPRR
jgi:hypothetical protein